MSDSARRNRNRPIDSRASTALEKKVLWLAVWMIHHANHLRPKRDGLKVGGHQASSASSATLMTALYFDVLRPRGSRRGQATRQSGVSRDSVSARPAVSRESREVPRQGRRAVVPVAHQGRRRCGFLDRVGGARRGDDEFRRADARLSRLERTHRSTERRQAG